MTPNLSLPLPKYSEPFLERLRWRRSNLVKHMDAKGAGPDETILHDILNIAARVPDHRKLTPWRFIVFKGTARADFGKYIGSAFQAETPNASIDRVVFESGRLLRAPLVIAVISAPKDCPRGTPKWEQTLSSGVVCYNMVLAAQGHGFAAQWLTEWYAYNADVNTALGLEATERVAGYIYIGQAHDAPLARARPDLCDLVQIWQSG